MVILTQFGGVVIPAIHTQKQQSAIKLIEQALLTAGEREQAELIYRLGALAFEIGEVRPRALDAFTRMQAIAVALPDKRLEAMALNALSVIHDHIGRRNDSLREALEAEKLALEVGDQEILALALNNQAQFYKETGSNPRAFGLFRQVRDIGASINNRHLLMAGTMGMGRATCMADYASALDYIKEAMVLCEELGDDSALAICYSNRADWEIYIGSYAAAIASYEKSEQLAAKVGCKDGVGRTIVGRAKVYSILQQYDLAWTYLTTGLPLILSTADIEAELHTYLHMAHIYLVRGDVGRACDYYQRTLNKSLLAPDSSCAIFAQKALEQVTQGQLPKPGILPPEPLKKLAEIKTELLLKEVHHILSYTYPTGDRPWGGLTQ